MRGKQSKGVSKDWFSNFVNVRSTILLYAVVLVVTKGGGGPLGYQNHSITCYTF